MENSASYFGEFSHRPSQWYKDKSVYFTNHRWSIIRWEKWSWYVEEVSHWQPCFPRTWKPVQEERGPEIFTPSGFDHWSVRSSAKLRNILALCARNYVNISASSAKERMRTHCSEERNRGDKIGWISLESWLRFTDSLTMMPSFEEVGFPLSHPAGFLLESEIMSSITND